MPGPAWSFAVTAAPCMCPGLREPAEARKHKLNSTQICPVPCLMPLLSQCTARLPPGADRHTLPLQGSGRMGHMGVGWAPTHHRASRWSLRCVDSDCCLHAMSPDPDNGGRRVKVTDGLRRLPVSTEPPDKTWEGESRSTQCVHGGGVIVPSSASDTKLWFPMTLIKFLMTGLLLCLAPLTCAWPGNLPLLLQHPQGLCSGARRGLQRRKRRTQRLSKGGPLGMLF